MILLRVEEIKEFGKYRLSDKQKNEYEIVFQFFGNIKIEKGDKVYLDEKYLDKHWSNFAQPFTFTTFEEEELKRKLNFTEKDFILVYKNNTNEEILLKRVYG